MKKLLILALVLVVAGGLFAQAAGPTVTYSGLMQYGTLFVTDATKSTAVSNYPYLLARWDVQGTEFTKAVWRLRFRADNLGAVTTTTTVISIPQYAFLESNILGELGIKGVKWILNAGLDDHDNIDLAAPVSPTGMTSVDNWNIAGWGYENVINVMDMVNIRAIFAPANWAYDSGNWGIAVDGGFGPVAANVGYTTVNARTSALSLTQQNAGAGIASDPAKGMVGFGARFSQDVAKDIPLAAFAAIRQNLNLEQTTWGVSAKVGYQTLATVALGAMGFNKAKSGTADETQDSWFSRMEARVVVMPISLFSLDVCTVLNIDKDRYTVTAGEKNILNDLDIRANLHVNKMTTLSVGYLALGSEGYRPMLANEIGRIGVSSAASGNTVKGLGGFYVDAIMKW